MTSDLNDTGPAGTARIVQIGDERYRRAILDDHIRHLIMPGTNETLCCEAVGARWLVLEAGRNDRGVPSTCRQCGTHRYWLPASGELERNASLDLAIEPHAPTGRQHVTGDNDPRRGRYARPESLQICLTCGQLRGLHHNFDNLCACDQEQWEATRLPRYGDISNSAHLCGTCAHQVVHSITRWSLFHCDECVPATAELRRRLVGNPIPWGWHSLTNGIGLRADVAVKLEPAGFVAFHDQLQAQFANQGTMFELVNKRILDRVATLGFDGHTVRRLDYLRACHDIGFGPRHGFEEFLAHVLGEPDPDLADEVWRTGHEHAAENRHRR